MKKTVQDIAKWLNTDVVFDGNPVVTGVSINTRTLQKGDLFIPFKGEQANGHHYIDKAIEAGASATIWQKGEPNAPTDIPVLYVEDAEKALQQMAEKYRAEHSATFVGITGSNGKTSTKDLVAGTLSPYFKVQKTEGNFNNQLGLPLTILSLDEDTQFAIIEMGMDGFGQIEFLSKLAKPHHVIITNIGEAHMEALGSRAGIAKAKFEIIAGLQENGRLFYDGDEPLLRELVDATSSLRAASFGFGQTNDLYATNVEPDASGSQFDVHGSVEGHFSIQVLGDHQVKNTLAAICIAHEAGLSNEAIKQSLQSVSLTNMRMQLVNGRNGVLFVNDAYNAAPTSMRAALRFMKETKLKDVKWLVLGDMLELGDQEMAYHRQLIDDISADAISHVALYGSRMRVLYDALLAEKPEIHVMWSEDNQQLIVDAIAEKAQSNTIILFKGSRGMALEKIIEQLVD